MQPILAPAPQMLQPSSSSSSQDASEQALRAHLLAQVANPTTPQQRTHAGLQDLNGNLASLQHVNVQHIDPAIAGVGTGAGASANGAGLMSPSGESGDEMGGSEGKKGGKRELSTSKRAAQNRAAQRAFRQRKEGHIKKLEQQVQDYNLLNDNYKAVQAENYQLRDYIINLQSRLIESQGDFPQPPSNIALQHPRNANAIIAAGSDHHHHHHHLQQQQQQQHAQHATTVPIAAASAAPTAPMAADAMTHLQASAAQAVADLGAKRFERRDVVMGTASASASASA